MRFGAESARDRDHTLAEVIRERRRRLGADYEPPERIPEEVFEGCRGIGDAILRARRYRAERARVRPSVPTSE